MEEGFTLVLPGDLSTPKAARHAVAEFCGDHARCGELLLCVSEVVTNAVLHARSTATLTVRWRADVLTVEVSDDDPTLPVRRPHSITATTGRGLRILDELTVRWGARPTLDGKVVWFDFDLGAFVAQIRDGRAPEPWVAPETARNAPEAEDDERDGYVRIEVHDDLDLATAPNLRNQMVAHAEAGVTRIIVDLSRCHFLDSTGLSLLVTTHHRLLQAGGGLRVEGASGQVHGILDMAGATEFFGQG